MIELIKERITKRLCRNHGRTRRDVHRATFKSR